MNSPRPRFFLMLTLIAAATVTCLAQTRVDPISMLRSSGATANQLLVANGAGGFAYQNVSSLLTAGTGTSISSSGVITNNAPDQIVSFDANGIVTITGSYPNFSISAVEADGSITNEKITSFSRSGSNLRITEGSSNIDLALSTLISANAGNALSLSSGQFFVAQSAAVSSQRKPYVTSSAVAAGGTFTTTGLTLPASTNNFYVYLDGAMMDAKEGGTDTDWDYDRSGTSQLTWNRLVPSGSKILIVY